MSSIKLVVVLVVFKILQAPLEGRSRFLKPSNIMLPRNINISRLWTCVALAPVMKGWLSSRKVAIKTMIKQVFFLREPIRNVMTTLNNEAKNLEKRYLKLRSVVRNNWPESWSVTSHWMRQYYTLITKYYSNFISTIFSAVTLHKLCGNWYCKMIVWDIKISQISSYSTEVSSFLHHLSKEIYGHFRG